MGVDFEPEIWWATWTAWTRLDHGITTTSLEGSVADARVMPLATAAAAAAAASSVPLTC